MLLDPEEVGRKIAVTINSAKEAGRREALAEIDADKAALPVIPAPEVSVTPEINVDMNELASAISSFDMDTKQLETVIATVTRSIKDFQIPKADFSELATAISKNDPSDPIEGLSTNITKELKESTDRQTQAIQGAILSVRDGFQSTVEVLSQQLNKIGASQAELETRQNAILDYLAAPRTLVMEDGKPVGVEINRSVN